MAEVSDEATFSTLEIPTYSDSPPPLHPQLVRDPRAFAHILQSIEYSADLKEFRLSLHPDAKWSDGHPITTDDFEFAWKDIRTYSKDVWDVPEFFLPDANVYAIDDRTIAIELARPYLTNPDNAYWRYFTPEPAHYLRPLHPKYNDQFEENQANWEDFIEIYRYKHDRPTVFPWVFDYDRSNPPALVPNQYYQTPIPPGNMLVEQRLTESDVGKQRWNELLDTLSFQEHDLYPVANDLRELSAVAHYSYPGIASQLKAQYGVDLESDLQYMESSIRLIRSLRDVLPILIFQKVEFLGRKVIEANIGISEGRSPSSQEIRQHKNAVTDTQDIISRARAARVWSITVNTLDAPSRAPYPGLLVYSTICSDLESRKFVVEFDNVSTPSYGSLEGTGRWIFWAQDPVSDECVSRYKEKIVRTDSMIDVLVVAASSACDPTKVCKHWQ